MKFQISHEEHTIVLDPHRVFVPEPTRLLDACGLLLPWATSAHLIDPPDYKEALLGQYPFYMGEMEGGEVLSDGTYQYPGDPPLYPIAEITHPDIPETLFIYQYGIVAVVYDNPDTPTWVTRMD